MASAARQDESSAAERKASEATAIKQAEKKLRRLEGELHTLERAATQSENAKQRVESRLAKELYFQQLFRQGIEHQRKHEGPWKDGTALNEREQMIIKMNELRKRAETEARKISNELHVALKMREEEHSARLRETIQGCTRRILNEGIDEFAEKLHSTPLTGAAAAATLTRLQSMHHMSATSAAAVFSTGASRHASSAGLNRAQPAAKSPTGTQSVEQHDSEPLLSGLQQVLSQSPSEHRRRSNLRAAVRATNMYNVLESLVEEHVARE